MDNEDYKDALKDVSAELDVIFPTDETPKKKWWKTLLKVLMCTGLVIGILLAGVYFYLDYWFSNAWY